jgi:SP family arabinose:H+ symporter-like MFS transporter
MQAAPLYRKGYVLWISITAAMGGIMFGYDLGVITGVIPFIQRQFLLSALSLGWIVAIFELGAAAGTFVAGWLAERTGRKKALVLTALSFVVTTAGIAVSANVQELGAWRFFQGFGVGAVSVLSPLYIAEIAPASIRGKLVSVNQLSIIIGFILATVCCYYFGDPNHLESWRWMFGSAIAPAVLFFAGLFFIPESPRWLMSGGQLLKAKKVLQKIGNESYADNELKGINDSLAANMEQGRYSDLFTRTILPVLLIGFGLAILQQLCGANNVTAYLQVIFEKANITIRDGLLNAVFVAIVFFVFTVLSIMLVDKLGRKKLMLAGTSLMALFLFLLAWSFNQPVVSGTVVFIFIIGYIATYAFSLAPVTWVLLSEIFPNYIRSKALSLSSCILWLATFGVVLISPALLKLSPVMNFVIFGVLNVLGIFFVWRFVPETKGQSLEDIERRFIKKM